MRPLSAPEVLDRYFLEARSKLLDLAAILDRIDRGGGLSNDPRLQRLHEGLAILQSAEPGRAERVQVLFSIPYEAGWKLPTKGQ